VTDIAAVEKARSCGFRRVYGLGRGIWRARFSDEVRVSLESLTDRRWRECWKV